VIRLLDAVPDLAAALGEKERVQATLQLVAATAAIDAGPWDVSSLDSASGAEGEALGFLVLKGAVAMRLDIAGRTCTRLILAQDLMLLDTAEDDVLPLRWSWAAIEQVTLAVFDQRLMIVARRWPEVLTAVLNRGALQVRHALLQQAICQLPRVEDRLLGFLWAIADRRGVVQGRHIRIELPITHELFAQLIGARRPTVSMGFKNLAESGLVTHDDRSWLLARDSLEIFRAAVSGGR
jgi:DNA-binding XRE family transcriptional regulator